ncbi:MAG TPA: patatin-like phospholipase family protein [Luteibacter sp.]|jgi:hypothetical protein|uniref:patatin-like phospholipase family protein n=1 Tax=Luteibacter sp. TaxID=1886636 RepID=UPI002F4029EF
MTDTSGGAARPAPAPHEQEALAERRRKANVAAGDPLIGLALSGGGIRSATFCLGVLRALAGHRLLHRFDYLSTVSGGGYVGSAFGRLFNASPTGQASAVETGVARDDTSFLWWLRNNGRFLAPAGTKDLMQAWSSHLRGFLATQMEIAVLAVLLACVVTLPHLAYVTCVPSDAVAPFATSIWWWLLPLPAAVAAIACYGYWFLGRTTFAGVFTALITAAVAATLAWRAWNGLHDVEQYMWFTAALLLAPAPIAWLVTRASGAMRPADANRVRYTTAFAACLKVLAVVAALGALDMASWYVHDNFSPSAQVNTGWRLATTAGIATAVFAVVRALAPAANASGKAGAKLPWLIIAQGLGIVMLAILAVFWTTVFQFLIFPADQQGLDWLPAAWSRWLAAFAVVVLYLVFNGRALGQLNQSSLHFFYRSRLARTYVAVGNGPRPNTTRATRFPADVLATNTRPITQAITKVTELMPGDDVALAEYTPHLFGGPVHLINCCINQTVDDRTGTYNADRKGVCVTVSALGVETGTHGPESPAAGTLAETTLAEWVAISGAAVSSGMGSNTRPGVAALLFLSGLRLGYWQRNLNNPNPPPWRQRVVPKYGAMLREMFARFPGLRSAYWYLTDGGHFDNTGVYPLLKRELPLIVLVDCGADPDYRFADVENLVRKARIDYDAGIAFVDPAGLATIPGAPAFGTPDTISADPGAAHLMLARICYASGARGTLLVIKPRLQECMALDVAGYADRDPTFPQQSTAQQFFSESQWESYCQLGRTLGDTVSPTVLDNAMTWAWATPVVGTQSTGLSPTPAPETRQRGARVATTVGTSIGVGALLTALIAGWQTLDDERQQQAALRAAAVTQATKISAEVYDISDKLALDAPFDSSQGKLFDRLVADLSSVAMSDDLRHRVGTLLDPLAQACKRTTDPGNADLCGNALMSLNNQVDPPDSDWTMAMASYDRWRDQPPSAAPQADTAGSVESGETPMAAADETPPAAPPPAPEAAPAPPPPPPPQPEATQVVNTDALARRVTSECAAPGQPFTLYTQVYDEKTRALASPALADLRGLGVVVPGIENVAAMAAKKGRPTPYEWRTATVLYPPEGAACAAALVNWANGTVDALRNAKARAVPMRSGVGRPNVLELWLPRR